MIKFLIGPVLMGVGYAAGSFYGASSEQVVHKNVSVTYAGVEAALAGVRDSGTTSFEGGTPMPYTLSVDHTLDRQLLLHLSFDGRQGAEAELDFTPQNGGEDTLVTARVHGDHEVLRSALAGTNRARLAYAPDWMLNLAMRPLLQQLATQIEQGKSGGDALAGWSPSDAEAQWESQLTPEQRGQVAQWQQYQATRPALDPNADSGRGADGVAER
jgi:hypothetical protein